MVKKGLLKLRKLILLIFYESFLEGLQVHLLDHQHEYDFDDIWIRDYGPKLTISGVARLIFNGYGGKYFHKNDSLFFNYLMKIYPRNNNDMFNGIVIEGGNIINSSKDYIMNINPIIMHNQLSSISIKNKVKELIKSSKSENVSFGFYNSLILFLVIIITLSKGLHFFKDFIILKLPITEFYINYFFESIRNMFEIWKNLISNY